MPKVKHNFSGFTLVEMAIVLALIALMLGTGLTVLSAQQDQQRMENAKARLDDAHEALIGFALVNGRLPCPADPTIPSGTTGAGQEYSTCTTSTYTSGVLPWATLGINETDAWGRRLSYVVTNIYADAINAMTYGKDNNPSYNCATTHICTPTTSPQFSSFALCSCGELNVLSNISGGNIAANTSAVVISYGANGLGAYTTEGHQITPIPAATTNEGENTDSDSIFISHTPAPLGEVGGYFDDQVIWLSKYTLFNRMVQAGKLP
jgi:prepilin-type N-terminal cleavage/methylation domain-containing protein